MSTLYLSKPGMTLAKDGGRLVVKQKGEEVQSLPAHYVKCVVVLAEAQVTYAALMEVMENEGLVLYLDHYGTVKCTAAGEVGRSELFIHQLKAYLDEEKRLKIAKALVQKKISGQEEQLRRGYAEMGADYLLKTAETLRRYTFMAGNVATVEKLMGIEGLAAREYFDCFPLLLQTKEFTWEKRSRRPAQDGINAMLNFGYALLEKDVRCALAVAGLCPDIGYLHALNNRKSSLVYDVMEPFRPEAVDAWVLSLVNSGEFKQEDFTRSERGLYLTEQARRRFIASYERKNVAAEDEEDVGLREKIARAVRGLKTRIRPKEG